MTQLGKRIVPAVTAALLVGALVGCQREGEPDAPGTGAPPSAPASPATPVPSSSVSAEPGPPSPAAPPEPATSISYGPGAAPESSSAEQARPPAAPVPAPTADGPLDERSLPRQIAGFTGVTAEPSEGEFNPNGSWVYAVPAAEAAGQALPRCGPDAGQGTPPVAQHALAGKYSAAGGSATGNGLVLQFADDRAAADWYGEFVRQLGSCSSDLTAGATQFTDHRRIDGGAGQVAETGRVRGNRVLLIALEVTDGADGAPDLTQLGRELAEFAG